jgi:hypothetical protein
MRYQKKTEGSASSRRGDLDHECEIEKHARASKSTGAESAADSTAQLRQGKQTHLYVLVHGFNSRADHLQYMATEMKRRLGPNVAVYLSKCNQSQLPSFFIHPTHSGIDRGGERLAKEISEVVAKPEHSGLEYISFLGNSMGGLFIRFALGLLFDRETGACVCVCERERERESARERARESKRARERKSEKASERE